MVLLGFWDFFFFGLHVGILVTPLVCVCVWGVIPQLDYIKIFNYMFYILILLLTFVFFITNIDNKKDQ